jgi:hypothetical protein
MGKIGRVLAVVLCTWTVAAGASGEPAPTFYVSPRGSSNGLPPGTKGHPFTTVGDAVAACAGCPHCTIFLDSVLVHRVRSAVVLDERHSGLTIAPYRSDGLPVTPIDRAIISGGVVLTGHDWSPPTAVGSNVWSLNLSSQMTAATDATPRSFNQLFVDGVRAIRAREPELGSYFRMQSSSPGGFAYAGSDLLPLTHLPTSQRLDTVELVVYESWTAARRNVAAVDATQRTVKLTAPCGIEIEPNANSGSRYYAENFAAAVDTATEWFFDTTAQVLHYVPAPNSPHPSNSTFVVPTVSGDLFVVRGTVGLQVSGVAFHHADWSISPTNTSSGNVQAASFLDTAAVHLVNTTSVILTNCDVEHVGEYGIWVEGGSRHAVLDGVLVRDSGAGGLRIGRGKPLVDEPADGRTGNTTVIDSTFVLGSHVYHEGNGILLQHSSGNTVQRTEVAHYNHVGISVGWTWDFSPSQAHHNLIEECHVHHLGNGDLSDLGGIYLLGISPGTRVRSNVIHDANPYFQYVGGCGAPPLPRLLPHL